MNSTYIGIDFGTTKTLVSVYNAKKKEAKIIRLGRGRDDIPTSVYAAEDGSFLCGEDADDQRTAEPERYARAFKMKLGSEDPPLSFFDGTSFSQYAARDLSSVFLSYIRTECEKYIGKSINRAVITRPVRFSPMQCKELEDAARKAGFEELAFISEPEAAAHTFCRHQADDPFTNALIIDWGGGTLDMALVTRDGEVIKTYKNYTDGIPKGGENFDDALYWLAVERMQKEQGKGDDLEADMLEPEFNYAIRKNLRLTKETLSRLPQHALRLSGSQGVYPALKIQRSDFEHSIMADLEQAADMAQRLIRSINEDSLRPDKLILVGGSSRIPAVARLMQERTGLPCRTWDMSVEAVGLGAALVAAEHWEDDEKTKSTVPNETQPIESSADEPIAAAATEPSYQYGLVYLHGVGVERNIEAAIAYFMKGHESGDLSSSYMLCHCYMTGLSVPRDEEITFRMAKELVEKKYYPAYYFLHNAYHFGKGTQRDKRMAQACADQLLEFCAQPIAGIDEIFRYDALLNYHFSCPQPDCRIIENLAYANMAISYLPQRFAWLSGILWLCVTKGDENPSLLDELRRVLENGIKENDHTCLYLMGVIMSVESPVYPQNKKKALELIRKAVASGPADVSMLTSVMELTDDENEYLSTLQLIWKISNYGVSCIQDSNRLESMISLDAREHSRIWKVVPQEILRKSLEKGDIDGKLFCNVMPFLRIENQSERTWSNISLRICSAESNLDKMISVNQALQPRHALVIDLLHYDMCIDGDLYVEVYSDGRKATMEFSKIADFMRPAPPLALYWEKGIIGGIVVKMFSVDGSVPNVHAIKLDDNHSATSPTIVAEQPVNFGWMEFADNKGLLPGEVFIVHADEYGPLAAQIAEDERSPFLTVDPQIERI